MIHKLTSSTFCLTLALVAMLAMATRSSATDKQAEARTTAAETPESSSPNESYGGQCRAPIGGDATRSGLRGLATVERSLPGTWRRDLKFGDPVVRIPMSGAGTVISPEGPAPVGRSGNGRWLDGYRPSTPRAQAEYKRWLRENQAEVTDGLKVARSNQLLPPQYNLMNPGQAQKQGEQPTDYVVRHNVAVASVVDVKKLSPGTSAPKDTPKHGIHHHTGLSYEQYRELKERAKNNREETPGAQDADQTPVTHAPSPLIAAFDAISATGGVPPDPTMAAGASHVVVLVNSHYRVFDKTGTPLIPPISLDSFFASVPQCVGTFDPFIDYDEENDRWVMGMDDIAGADSYFCIAASQTGDPTGSWNVYSFQANTNVPSMFADFPQMGIGLDAVYITANMFDGTFQQIRAYAVDKAALYAGSPISVAESNLGGAFFTAQPTKIHGFLSGGWPVPGTPHHFIAHNFSPTTRIWRWVDPFVQAPTIYGSVAATYLGFPPLAPELGGGIPNDTGGSDFKDLEYRDGNLYATRTIFCNIGGGDSESCVDWLKIDVSGGAPVLVEQQSGGAFGSADEYRYYPDIAVDRAGNIAIGYTKSSLSSYTELHVTGREVGDPLGQLQVETLQVAGAGNYTDGVGCGDGSCDRWGDYSGMTIDPDGCTFWFVGEYSDGGAGLWETNVGSYKFPSCSVESLVNVNKSTFNCGEQLEVTVSDSIALTEAEVSAQVVVTTSSGDSETIPVGQWTGSGCTGNACTEWTTQLPTSGDPASTNDGRIDVADGGTISVDYIDFHAGHSSQNRTVGVDCQTRFDDGGFLVAGGCEDGTGTELYRDYIDAGELIAYTAGFFNPLTAPALTDVVASLSISGPASGLITIYNPTVNVGPLGQGQLGGAVFYLSVDPSVDTAALRLSAHDFNISLTSPADGYIVPQVIVQQQVIQGDDVVVNLSECYNFESGTQGFQNERYVFSYLCDAALGCVPTQTVNTVTAPWTFGPGCNSETRTDQTGSTCDAGGSSAFKSNSGAFVCGNYEESNNTLMDDLLYSPIFSPLLTGTAPNGQPWNWSWLFAEWFYRSEHTDGAGAVTTAWAHYWDDNYEGISNPAENEVDGYPWFLGFFTYGDQDWDSATPWDPDNTPANYDAVTFPSTASGEATVGLEWRWAFENFDADFGGNPQATPPSFGTAIDNMQLFYDQYYADVQVGTCTGAVGTVAFDQFGYTECIGTDLGIAVLDGDAGGSVTVTVTSDGTGDRETVTIVATGPNYESTLPYSAGVGRGVDDGTLYVTPLDTIRISYDDTTPVGAATNVAFIDCPGGNVVLEGVVGLQDDGTGDGDGSADQNEIVDLSLRIRNDTASDLINVRAVISSSDSTVGCILKASADFGTIPANGGTASNSLTMDPFTFVVADTAQCIDPSTPPTATFDVLITADGLSGPDALQTFTLLMDLDLDSTVVLNENFDGVQPPGWTHQVGPGDEDGVMGNGAGGLACTPYVDNWFWGSDGGNTGGGFFCWNNPAASFPNGTYDDLLDAELISPVLVIPVGKDSATLTFDHEYKFASTSTLRADGAVVYYRVNAGAWQKIDTLPYDGPVIWNTYCSPFCNGGESLFDATPPATIACATENVDDGENIFCQLNNGLRNWITMQATISGLSSGDQVEFRWRVGSLNSAALGLITTGGYGLDNVQIVASGPPACDIAVNPKVGCGVTFDSARNLVELCGDGDSNVEPGEEWSVDVNLVNVGDTSAVNTVGDLTVNAGGVQATVSGNPGGYGTIAAGVTSTANYSFIVDGAAVCIDDLDFDVTSIADNATLHNDVLNAFKVQIGTVSRTEIGFQGTDPLESTGPISSSILSPIFSLTDADTGTLSYDFESIPVAGNELATQDTDPLNINNTFASSTLSPAFTATSATVATVDWTTLTSNNVNRCAQVALFGPGGASTILKAFNTDDLSPYDVLSFYQGNGPGQYTVELTDTNNGPCGGGGGFSNLSGTTMSVDGLVVGGDWDANARVYLWDGSTQTIVKDFGAADAGPYDISSLYTGSAQYEVRLAAQNGEGFRMTNGVMSITQASCDVAACVPGSSAPPVGDDVVGTGIRLAKGAGANDIDITFDTATCSDDHAIVVYGNLGDFTGYQGAVDAGCNVGTGGSTTFTHAGSGVWFNVLWVTSDDKAGHPGYDGGGLIRPWNAVGLCGATSDDPSDGVCN